MNSFGRVFKVDIFGESHGKMLGVIVDGCPAGISITEDLFILDLNRRKAGKKGTTTRIEDDAPQIISGVFNEKSTGTPIALLFANKNIQPTDYQNVKKIFRPSHSDFTAYKKYKGFNDYRGGGHFSGRLTLPIVAAGVIAKQLLSNIEIETEIIEAGGEKAVEKAVEKALATQHSIGAILECKVKGLPVGLGEPFWDSVESLISHSIFAIPGIKGIEFGSGFAAAKMNGYEHNDRFIDECGKTKTNHSGGINGGITNGNELIFKVAVKPTSSIFQEQETFNFDTQKLEKLTIKGRHDACFALRVPPIVEAMTAISLADLFLLQKRQ